MKLVATEDVPQPALEDLRRDLAGTIEIEIHDGRFFFKSLEAPSWIRLLAEAEWWQQGFAAIAALYVAELIKEAAKETWKSRAKAISAAVRAGSKLKTIALKLTEVSRRLPDRTEIVLALPQPNEYFGSLLTLSTTDPELVEIELALFVHHLPALSDVIRAHQAAGTRPATGYFLELLPNGDMHVLWFDQQSLQRQEITLPLRTSEV